MRTEKKKKKIVSYRLKSASITKVQLVEHQRELKWLKENKAEIFDRRNRRKFSTEEIPAYALSMIDIKIAYVHATYSSQR